MEKQKQKNPKWNLFTVRENDINNEKTEINNENKDGHNIKHAPPQPRILGARIPWPG